ncbi:hypothetical protein DAMA08_009780 [Martiniozyma asiatica (nom. inval.)]|nr:hypothetical protein DAMA08_009780 [Martiniozyma asiatica]
MKYKKGITAAEIHPRDTDSTFGLETGYTFFTIDTGANLVFKIRRQNYGASTESPGDIASLIYNGVQYQDSTRGT